MAIRVDNQVFSLETEHTLYQMKVDTHGVLNHLWYGPKTGINMDYLLNYPVVSFSGSIYEEGNNRKYSLDTLPLEYAASGDGDYRTSAIAVTHANGSNGLNLRYDSHEVLEGKYSIPGLPAVYANKEDAQTLKITLKDMISDVYVTLQYGILFKEDVITRSVVITNRGKESITITKAHSMCMDLPSNDWEWIHFPGRYSKERQVERKELFSGIQEIGSRRGTSSHQNNPSVILCEAGCTEEQGFCIGATFVYSGGFQVQIEKDQLEQVRMVMGIQSNHFSWLLEENQSFYTPEVILSCSNNGLGLLSNRFHSVIRNHVCRGKYQYKERPVLINTWETTYFDFDNEKILKIAKQAAKLGVEMLVLDDGWFGKRDDDNTGLGDWFVNEEKLKGGLSKLIEQVNDIGMKFGIWFEPEAISEDSELYRAHPEWVIRIPERGLVKSRNQLVLDMSREDVRTYLYDAVATILRNNNIEYVKWDMNRSICDWYSELLPPNRQGELPHRYMLGLYELLERLTRDFPDVLFEGCSGGGGRFDAGMLYYCPQIWCSDNTDAQDRTKIQYGTSFFYPTSSVGAHVAQNRKGREISMETRGIVAMAGSFGYELDLNLIHEDEKEQVKQQIQSFKKYYPLIQDGTYYRLKNPFKDNLSVWSFVSKDGAHVLLQGVGLHRQGGLAPRLRLRGLHAEANYRNPETNEIYTGVALMTGGIQIPYIREDNQGFQMEFINISK